MEKISPPTFPPSHSLPVCRPGFIPSSDALKRVALCALLGFAALTSSLFGVEVVSVQGSASVTQVFTLITPLMRSEFGLDIQISNEGGSSQAINAVGVKIANIAISARPLTASDRAAFPARTFTELRIGSEAFALVVASDVWNSGVHALTREQMTSLYERRVANWKALGGEDRAIQFYCPQPSKSAWEHLARWLYGDVRTAPIGKFEIVGEPQEARDQVEFHAGAISLVPPKFVDGKRVFALGIQLPGGQIVRPIPEEITSGKYPMMRPITLVSGDPPTGAIKKVFDFLSSDRGQEWVRKASLVPLQSSSEP